MTEQLIKTFIIFFVVIEPVSLVPMFGALTRGGEPAYRRWLSSTSSTASPRLFSSGPGLPGQDAACRGGARPARGGQTRRYSRSKTSCPSLRPRRSNLVSGRVPGRGV